MPALNIIQYIPSTFNWKAAGLTVTQQVKTLSSSDLYLQVSLSISATVFIFQLFIREIQIKASAVSSFVFCLFRRQVSWPN